MDKTPQDAGRDAGDRRTSSYFDAAAGEPLHPAARAALLDALDDGWADPSRLYGAGRRSRLLIEQARGQIAGYFGARPEEVSFTASGTQAVQLGLLGAAAARRRVGRHLVVSAVEHSSVLLAAESLAATGYEVTQVAVNRAGRMAADELAAALRADTALVCVQSANHEVGTLQPVAEVAGLCRAAGVPLLVDAAQSAGRLPVPDGWSILAASAHKWGGPVGVGTLIVRTGTRWRPVLPGDEREGNRVPGLQNVPGIAAAAAGLPAFAADFAADATRLHALVEKIRTRVPKVITDVEVVGDPVLRLPHLVTFSCLYLPGAQLVTELDRRGFAVSTGSSCSASTLRPSHVLEAMAVLTHGNIRVSLSPGTRETEVDRFIDTLEELVPRLREGVRGDM